MARGVSALLKVLTPLPGGNLHTGVIQMVISGFSEIYKTLNDSQRTNDQAVQTHNPPVSADVFPLDFEGK